MPHTPHKAPVYMGTISKPHGIRGEMALFCPAEHVEALDGDVFLAPPGANDSDETPVNLKPSYIDRWRYHHGAVLITLKGVTDRTAAEALRRHRIFVERDKLPEPDDSEYYIADLIGLSVHLARPGGQTEALGILSAIDAPAGQELWAIRTPEGFEVLMPAVPEFVNSIDLDAGLVVISPPLGLLELYTSEPSTPKSPIADSE